MKHLKQMVALICAMSLSYTANAVPTNATIGRASAEVTIDTVERLARETGFDFTGTDRQHVQEFLASYNRDFRFSNRATLPVRFADDDSPSTKTETYLCIGGKLALVMVGFQLMKCVRRGRPLVNVWFTSENILPITGFIAPGYAGINAGAAINLSLMIHEYEPEQQEALTGLYESENDSVAGGTINGAIGPYGALLGHYSRPGSSITLIGYEAGLAVEAALSKLVVKVSDRM